MSEAFNWDIVKRGNPLNATPLDAPRLRVLSLGAGVQSTTIALMAAHGEIGPMPDCAIFADTQAEPAEVYEHLDWLCSGNVLPFPVHRVTAGSLRQELIDAAARKVGSHGRPPFFVRNPDGSTGMIRRQCTSDYKIDPIHKAVRELIGLKRGQRGPTGGPVVEQWIGISLDEFQRAKPSRIAWIQNRWPLIEKEIDRRACESWLVQNGYPVPPKSACTFCPFRSDAEWRRMRDKQPAAFADAVAISRAIEGGLQGINSGSVYLHRSLKPLDQVDLSTAEDRGQLNMFDNECEGMCGV